MDELEQRIRSANPGPVWRDSALSERAELELDLIMGAPPHASVPMRSRGRHIWPIWAVAAAAAIAVLAVVFFPHPPATMASPPALKPTPIDMTLKELAETLSLRAQASPVPGVGEIDYDAWSASVEMDKENQPVFVQPTSVQRRYSLEDASGTVRVVAADVAYGMPTETQQAANPGTVLEEYTFAAGEYPLLYTQPLPTDPSEVPAYFEQTVGHPQGSVAGDYFALVQDFGIERRVAGPDAAVLINFLASLDGVEVMGHVTDRLGRAGVAISTSTRAGGSFESVLIFSLDDGSLLSSEETYLGGIEGFDIDYPTVFNYMAWKDLP